MASGGADTTARKEYSMNLYISKKDAKYLIYLIENTEQTEELKERGQDLKGYLEGMLAD